MRFSSSRLYSLVIYLNRNTRVRFGISLCPANARKTVCITDFFVLQNYRGLGIGRELFSTCLESLKKHGIQWVLIANTIIPETMEPLLIQFGFKKLGSGFVADLCTED